MAENNLLMMLVWLGELTFASWLLSYGAEHLSMRYGAKFVGRTLLSVATTLPEIAIVTYAAAAGSYGIALGAGLGSNLLMMTLGLSIMLLIATTRLSKAPLKGIDVSTFKLDKSFLIITAVVGLGLFFDGYDFIDGFIFTGMFIAYLLIALWEMRTESRKSNSEKDVEKHLLQENKVVQIKESSNLETDSEINTITRIGSALRLNNPMLKASAVFLAGTIGILIGAEPFIHSLESFSVDVGVSVIVLAIIISPIAGEMPEKISMMLLARKGAAGASIAVANVLGSKILNNTLLIAVAVFGAMYHAGFYAHIENTPLLTNQMILVTVVTIIALIPMFVRKEIGLKVGILLTSLYIISLIIQTAFPDQNTLH